MHPTPLRVDKIGSILSVGISEKLVLIYRCGAGDGHTVRRPGSVVDFLLFMRCGELRVLNARCASAVVQALVVQGVVRTHVITYILPL